VSAIIRGLRHGCNLFGELIRSVEDFPNGQFCTEDQERFSVGFDVRSPARLIFRRGNP
jgi:hypothetical protein